MEATAIKDAILVRAAASRHITIISSFAAYRLKRPEMHYHLTIAPLHCLLPLQRSLSS